MDIPSVAAKGALQFPGQHGDFSILDNTARGRARARARARRCLARRRPGLFNCCAVARAGGSRGTLQCLFFFSSARCFCFWLVSGGCRPWLPLSLCVFGSRACVCVCSRGSGDGPARLCQKHVFFVAGRKIEFTILALHGALLGHAKIFMFFFAGRAAVFFQVGHAAAPRGDLNQFVIFLHRCVLELGPLYFRSFVVVPPLALAPEAQPPWPWHQRPSPPGPGPRGPAPLPLAPEAQPPWPWPQRPSPPSPGPLFSFARGRPPLGPGPRGPAPLALAPEATRSRGQRVFG